MPEKLTFALAQLNPVMGDIAGNIDKLRIARARAAAQGAGLLLTSELYISGYPPEDLVLKPSFQKAVHEAVEAFAHETSDKGPAVLLGAPWREGDRLHNAVLFLTEGRIGAKIFKHDLPNYGPFDEKRVFAPGIMPTPIYFQGHKLGVMICEDMWTAPVAEHLRNAGAQILLVPHGSPYEIDKAERRQKIAQARVHETGLPLVSVDQVGGQDELVFEGASFVLDANGKCIFQAQAWSEDVSLIHWNTKEKTLASSGKSPQKIPQNESAIYHALLLGLRDYVNKNGFSGVVLGLSGGIDSALAATLAVDALGPDKVWAVMLPSPYTSTESLEDAAAMAKALKCRFDSISITSAMEAFAAVLAAPFTGGVSNTTLAVRGLAFPKAESGSGTGTSHNGCQLLSCENDSAQENIQSRCRGIILMALSNKFGPMVLSTGNKSEMSVGYTTLYGDMCGGFAVLKDVYKTQIYKVARWRNGHRPESALGPDGAIIPENIFTRAPTAELKPNQTDQDNLPPYDILDDILECLIEKDMGVHDMVARGHDAVVVRRVWQMLDRAEYKRRQAPPGVKITRRNLGKDRRYPITNGYREA